MSTIVFGNGNMGQAIAAAVVARGEPSPLVLGRPPTNRHRATDISGANLAFDASRGDAVARNVAAALAAGCRRFVVATTGWDDDRDALDDALRAHRACAVASPNFSLGVALFLRLVDASAVLFGPLVEFDPYVVEWHRREKRDRPSGTAREIARRLLLSHPGKKRIAASSNGPPAPDDLEVAAVRAGASPGAHLVGFDGPGESIELRIAARDRSAYAAGALAAADWLRARPRPPGLHTFDPVVDELLASGQAPFSTPLAVAAS